MLRFVIAGVLLVAATALPALAEDVATKIIAMERAMLERSDRGDRKAGLEISAPDVIYQDPFNDKPIVGLPALTAYYASLPAGSAAPGQMSNESVQVMGDIAVLSFRYVSHFGIDRDWNCTEVYRKTADGWRIINSHWSLTKPLPQPLA